MSLTERKLMKDYAILSTQLTVQEMKCLNYCQQYSDCAADGECELQERAADIIATESEVTDGNY